MNIHTEKDLFTKLIQAANDVIGSKTFINILSNVLIKVEKEKLIIQSTDSNLHLKATSDLADGISGKSTVHCNRLLTLLRSLPSGFIGIELKDKRLVIEPDGNTIHCEMNTMDPEEFPSFPEISSDEFFSFPQKSLVRLIDKTIFAVSDDENRFFMNGVYLTHLDNSLVMVATDGRRLSYAKEAGENITNFTGIIIPIKVLRLVQRLASREGELRIAINNTHVFFALNNFLISAQSISGQFPDYQRVIPEKQNYMAIVNRTLLRDALRRVSVFAEKIRQVICTIEKENIILRAEDPEMGEMEERIPCTYEGDSTQLAFNYQYLIDPVMVEEDENMELSFSDASRVITMRGEKEDQAFHIIMPLRIS